MPGEHVWIGDHKAEGTVIHETAPRSYNVSTPDGGILRRNRRHLTQLPVTESSTPPEQEPQVTQPTVTSTQTDAGKDGTITTRSGRVSRRPNRLDPGMY